MSNNRQTSDLGLVLRVAKLSRPYWFLLALFFVVSLLATPLMLLTPIPLKIATDALVGNQAVPSFLSPLVPGALESSTTRLILLAAGIFVAVAAFRQAQGLSRTLLYTYIGEKIVFDLRSRMFANVQRISLGYHDQRGTADSTYRIQYDANSVQNLVVDGVVPFASSSITFVSMLYVILLLDWQLSVVALLAAPLMVILTQLYRRRLRNQAREVKRVESSAMGIVQEVLGSLRVVKTFAQEDREQERFSGRANEGVRARVGLSAIEGLFGVFIGLVTASASAAVLYIGAIHVESGAITIGELILIMGYLSQLYDPLKSASKRVGRMQSNLAGAERAFALLDEMADVPEREDALPLKRVSGDIRLEDISFSYQDDVPVLRSVSFHLRPGKRLGVYGATGAGKTTLISLLMRLYDPDDGCVRLDGVDVRDCRVADVRQQFAVVLQEPILFSTTIAENIAYAKPGASREEIEQAAKLASIHDFIVNLPDGYETLVGERGMRLSGGERQRVALARAFLKDAPILILDEPTSSVDSRTEEGIIEAMERLMVDRTTIMIAHRLSTLDKCDLWLEVEPGGTATLRYEPPSHAGEAVAAGLAPRYAPVPGNGSSPKRPKRKGEEYRVASAWAKLTGETLLVDRVEVLQDNKKAGVYRLIGIGEGSVNVIAKERVGGTLGPEKMLYERVLPELPVLTPQYMGYLEDSASDSEWLFIEDVGGTVYSPELHATMAATWLADLHTSASERTFDGNGIGRMDYLGHLRAGRRKIIESFNNPAIGSDDKMFLEELIALLSVIESRWDDYEEISRELPETLSHGDFSKKNVRIRESARGGQELLAFDWEMAGWGSPIGDLGGIDTYAYWRGVSRKWGGLTLPQVERLALVGGIFYEIASVHWASRSLPWQRVKKPMRNLRVYDRNIRRALKKLEGGTRAGGAEA